MLILSTGGIEADARGHRIVLSVASGIEPSKDVMQISFSLHEATLASERLRRATEEFQSQAQLRTAEIIPLRKRRAKRT
ncbi:MAG: hypothetical protein ABIT04_01665 [Novosphingobium sp.]